MIVLYLRDYIIGSEIREGVQSGSGKDAGADKGKGKGKGKYQPYGKDPDTLVYKNAANIQVLQENKVDITKAANDIKDLQHSVHKLNEQMLNLKTENESKADDAAKATSKPVKGLH